MLDIISMIIILFLLFGLPMILLIKGGNMNKTETEKEYEEQEEIEYCKRYLEEKNQRKLNRRNKIRRIFKWMKNFILGNK